ncbi:Vacuolar protein sorting-associated protein 16 [Rhizoclosmatium hyalinum]|nr:Vacuolar protein sorting-associated protein 16 [Rhizoclosmatium hyalinum]
MTVTETVYKLLVLGHANRAAKVKTDLKVPEKRFAWLKVKALVEQRNWDALDKFVKANQKMMPLSSVVEVLQQKNEVVQARIYADLLKAQQGQEGAGTSFFGLIKNAIPLAPPSASGSN